MTSPAGTKRNTASRSTNRLMSHGHAMRSTRAFSRVTHFIALSFRLNEAWALPLCAGRPELARAARGVPRGDAAADEARIEAPLDQRLRHVAPDVEAVGAVHGHGLVRRQLGDPLLDAIRIAPRRAGHQIHIERHMFPCPRVDNLHAAAASDLRGELLDRERR